MIKKFVLKILFMYVRDVKINSRMRELRYNENLWNGTSSAVCFKKIFKCILGLDLFQRRNIT